MFGERMMTSLNRAAVLGCAVAMYCGGASWAQSTDPLFQAKGDHERTYKFTQGGYDSKYRVYVPNAWEKTKKLPLVVILHGHNRTHDTVFDNEPAGLKGIVKREADKHGFILVSVEGNNDGGWGSDFPGTLASRLSASGAGLPPPPPAIDPTAPELNFQPRAKLTDAERAHLGVLAEQDVLNVIKIVSKEYNTDPARLYLMGNSMGGHGTFYLAEKYPKMFTAIGPSDGPGDPTLYPYEKLKGIGGVMVVHGEKDPVAPIDDSEVMAYLIKKQGIDTVFERVPGGAHGDSWYKSLPALFDFFDAHPKRLD